MFIKYQHLHLFSKETIDRLEVDFFNKELQNKNMCIWESTLGHEGFYV